MSETKIPSQKLFLKRRKYFTADAAVICLCRSLLLVVIGSVATVGCGTSVRVRHPAPTLKEPQVAGKSGRLHGGLSISQGQWLTAISNASARPPVLTQSLDSTYISSQALTNFGIGREFELGFEFGVAPYPISPLILNLRWQALGPSLSDEIKKGDMSLGFSIGFGSNSSSVSGDQRETWGPGGYPWRGDAVLSVTETSATFGYHFDERTLLYTGISGNKMTLSGKVTHERSTTGDSPAAEYTVDPKNGWSTAPGIGLRFGEKVTLAINLQYLTADWFGTSKSSGEIIGSLNIGFRSGASKPKITEQNESLNASR